MHKYSATLVLTISLLVGCSSASELSPSVTPTNSQSATFQTMTKQTFLEQTSSKIEYIEIREISWSLVHDSGYVSGLDTVTFNFTSEMAKAEEAVSDDFIGEFVVYLACQGPGTFELELDASSVAQTVSPRECGSEISWTENYLGIKQPVDKLLTKIKGSSSNNQYRFILLYKK